MKLHIEPRITVQGHLLMDAEASAIRVAVAHFLSELSDDEFRLSLGDIGESYRRRLTTIQNFMLERYKV